MAPDRELTQNIIVRDAYTMHDDGEEIQVPSLDTDGWVDDREELKDAVARHVDLDGLANHVNEDVGIVRFDEHGNIETVELHDDILNQYGH